MTWVGENRPDPNQRQKETQRVWKRLVNRLVIAESESQQKATSRQDQSQTSHTTGRCDQASIDSGDESPSLIGRVSLDPVDLSRPRNRRTEPVSVFGPSGDTNSFVCPEDKSTTTPQTATVGHEIMKSSHVTRGENDKDINPNSESDVTSGRDSSSPCSMPSLGTISSYPSTDFESTSRSSSKQISSSSAAVSMPSLMSISSPGSSSTPKLPSPQTPDWGTNSVPEMVVDRGDEKPVSELTLDVHCHQQNVHDGDVPCQGGQDNEAKNMAPSRYPVTSSPLHHSFSPPRYVRGAESRPSLEPGSSFATSNHSSDRSPIGEEFLIEGDESEVGSRNQMSFNDAGESMEYSEATHTSRVIDDRELSTAAPCPSDDHGTRMTRRQRRRRHSENSKLAYDGILLQLVESIHGSGEGSSVHLSATIHTSNKGQAPTCTSERVDSRTLADSTKPKHAARDNTGGSAKEAEPSLQGYLFSGEARVSTVSPFPQEASSSRISSQSLETLINDESFKSNSKTKARRRPSGTSSVGSSSSSCESTRKSDSRHRRPPPPKHPRRHSLLNPASTKRLSSDGLVNADSVDHEPRVGTSKSGSPRIEGLRKDPSMGRFDSKRQAPQPDHKHGTRSSHGARSCFASPLTIARKLCAEDLHQIRHSAPPRLGRIRSPRRRIIDIAHHFDTSRSRRSSLSTSPLSVGGKEARLSTIANPPLYEATPTTLSPRVPQQSPDNAMALTVMLNSPNETFGPADYKAKTVRRGNRTLDLIPEIADIKQSHRPSGTTTISRNHHLVIGLPPFLEDDDESSSSSSGSSFISTTEDILDDEENSVHPSSPRVAPAGDRLHNGDSASSHVTLSSETFSLPITPRHRKPRVKVPATSVPCLPERTGHSSCSSIEPLVRIDHGFRGDRVDSRITRTRPVVKSKKSRTRNPAVPIPSKGVNSRNQSDIPVALFLRQDRTSFQSEVTYEVSSPEDGSNGRSFFVDHVDNDCIGQHALVTVP